MTSFDAHRHSRDRLLAIRLPSRREARAGAEIVFLRQHAGREQTIYAAVCHEGWQQWGANSGALAANVAAVEQWRRGELADFAPNEMPGRS